MEWQVGDSESDSIGGASSPWALLLVPPRTCPPFFQLIHSPA